MRTRFAGKNEVDRKWYVIDAKDKVLGRLASRVASYIRGKHKPIFTPNVDTGDFIIIVNADKIKVTGNKLADKVYQHHTGYMGNLKEKALKDRMNTEPERVIEDAVRGMLPKNRLGRAMIKKLKVYRGPAHSHAAQKPELIEITK